MKKVFGILVVGILLLVGPSSQAGNVAVAKDRAVISQGTMSGGTWNTGIQIQNLGTQTASAVLEYYDQNGDLKLSVSLPPIPAGGSVNHTTSVDAASLASGAYSVVIASDQRLVAIANQTSYDGGTSKAGSYNGIVDSDTGAQVYLPLLFSNSASGWNTMFAVQNTGDAEATVFVNYSTGHKETLAVKPKASRFFDQGGAVGQPGHPAGLPSGFFSAVLTSTAPIAAIVNEVNSNTGIALTYNGFTSGDTQIVTPLLFKQTGKWNTGVQAQNVGTSQTDIYIKYAGIPTMSVARNVAPGAFANFSQFAESQVPDPWFGGAVVTSTGQPIVAVVNETNYTQMKGMSYNGIPVSRATNSISLPLLFKQLTAWKTGVQIQNVGSAAADLYITYANDTSKRRTIPSVQPGTSANIYQPDEANSMLTSPWFGSAVVTSTQPIIAVVNESNTNKPGDAAMSYNAFNY